MLVDPQSLAVMGGAVALAGGLAGSAIGIATAATHGIATLAEAPKQFRNVIVLASLPMTQTFYGLIILILILTGSVGKVAELGAGSGFMVLACGIIACAAECGSAIYQGRVCAAGIAMLPKTGGRILTNSMMLAVFVELIGVLGLVFTILALSMLGLF